MNDLSTVINRGGGGLKENPPCTPLKENKGRNSLFTVPVPVPIARAHTHAQGTPNAERTGSGTGTPNAERTETGSGTGTPSLRTGTGTVCLRSSGTGTGTGTAPNRPKVDAELILHGYNALGLRYDAVQTALYALRIPVASNGYNNARILRWHLRRLGEENFRQIVYDQWRENDVDGPPNNVASALIVKLWNAGGDVR